MIGLISALRASTIAAEPEERAWQLSEASPFQELQQLLEISQQCAVRQRIASYAQRYRVQGEEFKKLAARAHSPQMREALLLIASSHERLTKLAEASLPLSSEVLEE